MNQETIVNEPGLEDGTGPSRRYHGMGALSPAGRGVEVMWDTLCRVDHAFARSDPKSRSASA